MKIYKPKNIKGGKDIGTPMEPTLTTTQAEQTEQKVVIPVNKMVKVRKQRMFDNYFITIPITLIRYLGINADNYKSYFVKYHEFRDNKIEIEFVKVS